MAVSPLYRSNPVRMMGMASGMDTESIIQATLRMHQFKIDRQLRNRQIIEWKQKMHNDIKDQITSLKNTYLSNLGSKTMMNRNVFNTNLATATIGGAATNAVSVTASVNAGLGSMTIEKITSLAKGASITSSAATTGAMGNGFTTSQTLGSLTFSNGAGLNFGPDKANVTDTNGNQVTVNKSAVDSANWTSDPFVMQTGEGPGSTIKIFREGTEGAYTYSYSIDDGAKTAIPTGGPVDVDYAGVTLRFTADGNNIGFDRVLKEDDGEGNITETVLSGGLESIGFTSKATVTATDGSTVELTRDVNGTIKNAGRNLGFYGETSFDITFNGETKTINLTSNMTITDMLNKVNTEVPGVTMSYDRMQDKFSIVAKESGGAAGSITISNGDGGGNLVSQMFGTSTSAAAGSKAEVKINGQDLTFDSNVIEYRGITIRLNETSDETITVNVTRDTDKAVNAIKDFIEGYNSLISKLEGLLNERKTSREQSYTPLTDEEKSTMTEKQIEEWEAIAKKGLLRDDRSIQNLVSSLRASFFEQIEGTGLSASQIGLTTGNYFDGTGGQIIINEDRLRAALEADPDRVADVFVKIDSSNGLKGQGLMHKINDILTDYTRLEGAQDNTIKALEKSYNDMMERIAKLEERMYAEEDKLYRQFAAMETALSKIQSQGDWFAAMLGG